MAIPFTSRSREQLLADLEADLIEEGKAVDLVVLRGLETTTRDDAAMIVLDIGMTAPDGRQSVTHEFLIPTKNLLRVFQVCAAFGLRAQYDAGSLSAADFAGKTAKGHAGIERDKSGTYPPKNVIRRFSVPAVETGGLLRPTAS